MKHKKLFISLVAVATVAIFFAVFLMIWFFGDRYEDFADNFRQEFEIAGLKDGATPQGITAFTANYDDTDADGKPVTRSQQYFFVSAYMKDGSPSRIYVTGDKTGYVGYVTMKTQEGEDFYGHCGGIATNGGTLWVTGENKVHVAKASKEYSDARKNITREIVERAASADPEQKYVTFTAEFNANCNASYIYYFDDPRYTSQTYDRLYVGEFYRAGNYKTDEKHKLTTPAGYKNNAFMYEYNVSSSSENKYGLVTIDNDELDEENKVPRIQRIFSLPEKIQGVAFSGRTGYGSNDGLLVLSQSYALANSHLLCFDYKTVIGSSKKYNSKDVAGESFVYDGVYKTIGSSKVPYTDETLNLYYVDLNDKAMFVKDYSIPSMSEGLCVVTPNTSGNGPRSRVYVLFESATKKYGLFVREQLKHVYSFIPRFTD